MFFEENNVSEFYCAEKKGEYAMMKKIFAFVCLSMLIPASSFAWFHDDTDRWSKISGTRETRIYIDTETVKLLTDEAHAWISVFYPKHKLEFLLQIKVNYKDDTFTSIKHFCYGENGSIIKNFKGKAKKSPVIPGTIGEDIAKVLKLAMEE